MLEPIYTNRFKQELKLIHKRGWDLSKIETVTTLIINETPLPEHCRPHPLYGKWLGCMDCHVQGDWVLIYEIDPDAKTVTFHRTGTHADLFKK
jgi:mRNA interferase YafQ